MNACPPAALAASLAPRWWPDVGRRVSFWISPHRWWSRRRRLANETAAQSLLYCFNPWVGECHAEALRARAMLINPRVVAVLSALQKQLKGSQRPSVRPSTGLVGVGLALSICRRVSLFGFVNATDPRELPECDHYWECRFTQARYLAGHAKARAHDWPSQWRVLLHLLTSQDSLRYFSRSGGHAHRAACDGLPYDSWRRCSEA